MKNLDLKFAQRSELESAQIIEANGKETFDAKFTQSQRLKVRHRPGLFCDYAWPLAEAQRLDASSRCVLNERKNPRGDYGKH